MAPRQSDVIRYAENKKGITILKSVPRNELHFIDIHLVTLLNTWTHVAVPSKAVSSICSGSTILFCGNKESDNWYLLQNAGWLIEDNQQLKEQVKSTLASITTVQIQVKKQKADEIAQNLSRLIATSYDTIAQWAE
jgi:hypothetical protein